MRAGDRGFTYIGVLIVVALMGTTLAATGVVWHTEMRREKERELLQIGDQFRRAIGLYFERTPGPVKRYPQSLEVLVLDNRYPNPQRYLRRLYVDPMTGKAEWGLVKGPDGGIIGVHSLSEERPLKVAGFKPADAAFGDKERYAEWQFVYAHALAAERALAGKPPSQPAAGVQPGQQPAGAEAAGDAQAPPRFTRRRRR